MHGRVFLGPILQRHVLGQQGAGSLQLPVPARLTRFLRTLEMEAEDRRGNIRASGGICAFITGESQLEDQDSVVMARLPVWTSALDLIQQRWPDDTDSPHTDQHGAIALRQDTSLPDSQLTRLVISVVWSTAPAFSKPQWRRCCAG